MPIPLPLLPTCKKTQQLSRPQCQRIAACHRRVFSTIWASRPIANGGTPGTDAEVVLLVSRITAGSLMCGGDVYGRMGGAFSEEIFFHLLQQKFLRFWRAQVEPIFVHNHFHLLHPHLPGVFGN